MKIINLNVDSLTRSEIRSKLLKVWEAELPASGQYRYHVEQCADGSKIYLLRPASLNKGCDFKILSENFLKWKNGNDKAPKHDNVKELISAVLQEDITLKDDFVAAVECVYNCDDINEVLLRIRDFYQLQNVKLREH